jgi:hypothetical protein
MRTRYKIHNKEPKHPLLRHINYCSVDPAVFTHKEHFEILAGSLERQRVSAVAGGKLELPGQGVPKLELGNEGKRSWLAPWRDSAFQL